MSQVLITGATGLVGGHLLRLLLQEHRVNYIAAPTRRPLADISGVFNPTTRSLPMHWRRYRILLISSFAASVQRCVKRAVKRPLCMRTTRWWSIRR